jgi:HEAT repeat protein
MQESGNKVVVTTNNFQETLERLRQNDPALLALKCADVMLTFRLEALLKALQKNKVLGCIDWNAGQGREDKVFKEIETKIASNNRECSVVTTTNFKGVLRRLQGDSPELLALKCAGVMTSDELQKLWGALQKNTVLGFIDWNAEQGREDKVFKEIEEKIASNNQEYKPHPSDYVHLLLSAHVCTDVKKSDAVKVDGVDPKILQGWKVQEIFDDSKDGNYFSVLYQNTTTHQMVLAIRGAQDIIKTLVNEVLARKVVVKQQAWNYCVAEKVLDKAKKNGYRLSFTGHGLGAWLAELSVFYAHAYFQQHMVAAVTFDSPGTKQMMDKLCSNIKSADTNVVLEEMDIVTYLAAPNPINSCNQHVGLVYRISPQMELSQWTEAEVPKFLQKMCGAKINGLLALQGHMLGGFLAEFDASTGKPKQYKRMLDWPWIECSLSSLEETGGKVGEMVGEMVGGPFTLLTRLGGRIAGGVIDKLIGDTAIMSMVNLIANLCQGNFEQSQYWEFFKHAETKDGRIESKCTLKFDSRFALTAKAHYREGAKNRSLLGKFGVDNRLFKLYRVKDQLSKDQGGQYEGLRKQLLEVAALYTLISLKDHHANYNIEAVDDVQLVRQRMARLAAVIPSRILDGLLTTKISRDDFNNRMERFIEEQQLRDAIAVLKKEYEGEIAVLKKGYEEVQLIIKLIKPLIKQKFQAAEPQEITEERLGKVMEELITAIQQGAFKAELIEAIKRVTLETEVVSQDLLKSSIASKYSNMSIQRFSGESYPIAESYINLAMVEQQGKKKDEDNVQQPLEIEQLFEPGKAAKKLVIYGRAGIGKSTLCRYMATQWQQGALWQDKFAAVLWISLRELLAYDRDVQPEQVIIDLSLAGISKPGPKQIKQFLEQHGEKVLLILDGYHEVVRVVENGESNKPFMQQWLKKLLGEIMSDDRLHVVLTSRSAVRIKVGDHDVKFDKQVENIGFTNENIRQFIKKRFQDGEATKLISLLNGAPNLWGIASVPINLDMICELWQPGQEADQDLRMTKFCMQIAVHARALGEGGSAAPALTKVLKNRDEKVQQSAAEAWGEIVSAAVPALIEVLSMGNDPKVRAYAATVLGEIGPEESDVVPALIKALVEDYVGAVRQSAATALGRIGPAAVKAVPALIQALRSDKDRDVRACAASALGEIGPVAAVKAVPALIEVLSSGDPKVCQFAAVALGKMGSVAVPALNKALEGGNPNVSVYLVYALGKNPRSDDAVRALKRVLYNSGTDSELSKFAATALGILPNDCTSLSWTAYMWQFGISTETTSTSPAR